MQVKCPDCGMILTLNLPQEEKVVEKILAIQLELHPEVSEEEETPAEGTQNAA